MRKTKFFAEYDLIDVTAAADATETTSDNQSFGDVSDLSDSESMENYATLEDDFFILDGSLPEMPDNPDDVVFFSDTMSDDAGAFADDPQIVITFSENHTSFGLTFHFVGDYPKKVKVDWYTLDNIILESETYDIDNASYFAQKQVENYGKIVLTFTEADAYRYVKLRLVEYGTRWAVGGDGLPCEKGEMITEIAGEANKIPINTLQFEVIDEYNQFNLGNMAGIHRVLQQGQKCRAYEYVDDVPVFLGVYYLNESSASKNVATLKCVDAKGLLDDIEYIGGAVYDGTTTAGTVIADILAAAGIEDYAIDLDVASVPLYGWLKNQTCRKALVEILFACGAVCDSAYGDKLRIFKPTKIIQNTIKRTRKISTESEQKEYVSDVSVKYSVYTVKNQTAQIAKGHYAAGDYLIKLSAPATGMTATGATITEQSNNYVKISVASEADVVITGYKYDKEDLTETATIEHIDGGARRNAKSFTNSVLDAAGAMARAAELLDYYKYRLGLKVKYLADAEKPAAWSVVQNENREYVEYVAGIEKITTDLTGGYISNAEMRGYYDVNPYYYYMPEIYTADEIGDI